MLTLAQLQDFLQIQQLRIHSLENSLYTVEVAVGRERHFVVGKDGKPLTFRSQLEAKAPFKGLRIAAAVLVHASAYDEMVGLEGEPCAPMEVPISLPDDDYS